MAKRLSVVGVAAAVRPSLYDFPDLCQVGRIAPVPVNYGEDSRRYLTRPDASTWETPTDVTGSRHFTPDLYGG